MIAECYETNQCVERLTEVASGRGALRGDAVSVHNRISEGGVEGAAQHAHRGGLAGAVRPEKREHLTLSNVEGNVFDCVSAVRVDVRNVVHFQDGGRTAGVSLGLRVAGVGHLVLVREEVLDG